MLFEPYVRFHIFSSVRVTEWPTIGLNSCSLGLRHVLFVCLFVLRLNVPVNNFSVMSGRSQRFLGLTSTVGSRCALLKDTTR